MAETLKTLGNVLRGADTLDWKHALYLPYTDEWIKDGCIHWNASTPCAVLDPEESETDEPDDAPATRNKYMRCEKLFTGYDLMSGRFLCVRGTPGIATCTQQSRSVLSFLFETIVAHFHDETPPELLPNTS